MLYSFAISPNLINYVIQLTVNGKTKNVINDEK